MFGCFDIFKCYDCNAVSSLEGKPDIQISVLLARHAKALKAGIK